jgi:alkylation response protein AidB-like acyl-CoA dehydrogenase
VSASHDLLYGEIEEELRATVRAMLAERSPLAAVLERCESPEPYDLKLWRTLAVELGCAGLAVPEERGGAGASFREAAVVLEELGRAVAPVPFLGSAVVATRALLACGERELLPELAGGARTAALALPLSTPPGAGGLAAGDARAAVRADGDRLSGTVTSVADCLPADLLLVPTPGALYAVSAGAEGVTRSPVVSLDLTRQLCDLTLDNAPGRPLATGDAADRAVAAALGTGAALLASEQLGVAEWCLQTTVEHLKTRYQFGRPLGSFQALKHRLADLWVDIGHARAVARYAVACVVADDADAAVATALAQAHCSAVAVNAAQECVQLHGGIGFTWEHGAHLYLKRAKSDAIAFGTPDRHRAALAGLLDL